MRTKRVEVRFFDEEFAKLKLEASTRKMTLGNFIRTSLTQGTPHVVPQINIEALHELQKIGTNLNQIAHFANAKNQLDFSEIEALISQFRLFLIESKK